MDQWHKIYAVNKGVVGGNPDLILPGQKLTLP
jgi:nucleoid-associated protein YgaU